jgi:pimeloyl-ACP methyl ester carboxylesterase
MGRRQPADHLAWGTLTVAGRKVNYGVAGHGLPVLFLHGWALGSHTYKRALKRLVRFGCQVLAPALPEFGGSSGLPGGRCDLEGYAAWASEFLDAAGVAEPVLVVGHSLGGAVATKLAHDFPDRVAYLVLINSVGAGVGSGAGETVRRLEDRPLWHWAFHFSRDVAMAKGAIRTASSILEDALPNVLLNPVGMWRTGVVARRADLTGELKGLRAQGIPVTVLWGEDDCIIPRACFDATCEALGAVGHMVPGGHSWLIADPEAFAAGMTRAVTGAAAARTARAGLGRGGSTGHLVELPRAASS